MSNANASKVRGLEWGRYYGVRRVMAVPSAMKALVDSTEMPGYMVRHQNGSVAWESAESFDADFKPDYAMDFSGALLALNEGKTVSRGGTEALVLVDDLLMLKVTRRRIHELPVSWVLAKDWRIVGE